MKNKKKLIFASVLAMLGTSAMAQSNAKGNFEASAKMESFCTIQATDINFGVVELPLTSQSTTSEIKILCSNSAPYKIDLSYGGVYGSGNNNGGYTFVMSYEYYNSYGQARQFKVYKDGVRITNENSMDFQCRDRNDLNLVFGNATTATLFGYAYVNNKFYTNGNDLCTSDAFLNPKMLTYFGGSAYEYGIMNGAIKGDKLAYSISVPNESTKVWNKGVNSYNATGTGEEQTVQFNAKIVPEKSSSKYVAQDTYIDTVIAEVTY